MMTAVRLWMFLGCALLALCIAFGTALADAPGVSGQAPASLDEGDKAPAKAKKKVKKKKKEPKAKKKAKKKKPAPPDDDGDDEEGHDDEF